MELIEYKKEYQDSMEKFLDTMYDIMGYKFPEGGRQFDLENISSICINSNGGFWLAIDCQKVIGTIGLKIIDSAGVVGEIKRLFVLPEYQGKGFGKKLLLNLIGDAKNRGLACLRLCTNFKSRKAIGLYKALGFYDINNYKDSKGAQVFMELKL